MCETAKVRTTISSHHDDHQAIHHKDVEMKMMVNSGNTTQRILVRREGCAPKIWKLGNGGCVIRVHQNPSSGRPHLKASRPQVARWNALK